MPKIEYFSRTLHFSPGVGHWLQLLLLLLRLLLLLPLLLLLSHGSQLATQWHHQSLPNGKLLKCIGSSSSSLSCVPSLTFYAHQIWPSALHGKSFGQFKTDRDRGLHSDKTLAYNNAKYTHIYILTLWKLEIDLYILKLIENGSSESSSAQVKVFLVGHSQLVIWIWIFVKWKSVSILLILFIFSLIIFTTKIS